MAKPLSAKPAGISFAEGADRFAEMARQVKAQQIAEQQGTAPASPAAAIAPDEQWTRNFASQAFGASGVETIAARAPVRHARDFAPDLSALRPAAKPTVFQKADLGLPERPLEAGAPMNIGFLREEPKRRSFLARLFGRS